MTTDLAKWLLKQYNLLTTDEMPDLHLRTCQTHKVVPRGAPAFITGAPMSCDCPALDWWLSDLAAKLQIVKLHVADSGQHPDFCRHDMHELPCPTLRLLALSLSRRPGYREEWRP